MKTSKSEANAIIAISAMKSVIDKFLGPFLTAYFIQTSKDSLVDLSIYNIFSNIVLMIFSMIVSSFIERKFRIGMFRIGVVLNFGYILTIILLNENIVHYLWLIAILSGISSTAYWMPYNLFNLTKISNEDRTKYNITSRIVSNVIGIFCPLILGSLITVTNYILTAGVILVISFIQIILTFILKPDVYDKTDTFNPVRTYKKMSSNNQTLRSFNSQFLVGMTVNTSALEVLLVVLVFSVIKSNFNLGVITSISTIISILAMSLYGKIYKNREDKKIILFSSILVAVLVTTMAIWKNSIALVICYCIYMVLIDLIKLTQTVRADNVANTSVVDKTEQCEYNAIRETHMDFGRIISFTLLLVAAKFGGNTSLNILMIFLSILICFLGINIVRINKQDNKVEEENNEQ